ncbi:MAG: DUF1330 domain-containing protein [Pseudomonadota bacterium]
MPVYTIAQLTFHDLKAYRRYERAFPAIFTRFNGKLLAADEAPQVLEGQWTGDKVVVLAFPDEAEAKRFHDDPEYLAIAKDRHAGADATILRVRGWERETA